MDNSNYMDATLFEHRFWLQILGDHSRFIFLSLAPTESEYILTAQKFIISFDQLLEQSHNQLAEEELKELNKKILDNVYQLREFKIELLTMSLTTDLKSHLTSSFYNDMLNELEEYLLILTSLMNGQIPLFHPIHYHVLWLTDAVGHAATISSELDLIEKDMIEKACRFEIQFHDLNTKSQMMYGYLRTQLDSFPSLNRLNDQAGIAITNFMEFLEIIRDQRMDGRVLGTLLPLMADHMSREECYYLWKLSETTQNVRKPGCDPARPRIMS